MKKIILSLLTLVIIFAVVFGAVHMGMKNKNGSKKTEDKSNTEKAQLTEDEIKANKVDDILKTMTLEEKVDQLFIITPEALTGIGQATAAGETTKNALAQHPVGGIIYFTQNFIDEAQTKEMIKNTKDYAAQVCKLPLFISVDEEGGTVARLGNSQGLDLPNVGDMCEIGKSGDTAKAYEAGRIIGEYLKNYGFNMDFAPVADALTNEENQVVKQRSFSSDPQLAADMAAQLSKGLEDMGIISCYKHFPGHGATKGDTHEGFAYTDKTLEQLEGADIIPFKKAVEENADLIMVGHISVPNVTGNNAPSSVSPVVIKDMLRGQLGYKGIIITDALNMGALTELYSSDKAAVLALKAGADMLLMPEDFSLAYTGVLNALDSGEITEERIDESLRRIINKKLDIM